MVLQDNALGWMMKQRRRLHPKDGIFLRKGKKHYATIFLFPVASNYLLRNGYSYLSKIVIKRATSD